MTNMIRWRVKDFVHGNPTEEIIAETNTKALDQYTEKYHIDTRQWHLVQATPIGQVNSESASKQK